MGAKIRSTHALSLAADSQVARGQCSLAHVEIRSWSRQGRANNSRWSLPHTMLVDLPQKAITIYSQRKTPNLNFFRVCPRDV
eukprot:6018051-Amphidinium_carterae.1